MPRDSNNVDDAAERARVLTENVYWLNLYFLLTGETPPKLLMDEESRLRAVSIGLCRLSASQWAQALDDAHAAAIDVYRLRTKAKPAN